MEDRPLQALLVEVNAADARLIQEVLQAVVTCRFESAREEDVPQIEVETLTKDGDRLALEVRGRMCSRSAAATRPRSLSPFQSKGKQSHTEKKGDPTTDSDRRR